MNRGTTRKDCGRPRGYSCRLPCNDNMVPVPGPLRHPGTRTARLVGADGPLRLAARSATGIALLLYTPLPLVPSIK